jgi:hypothetical protein
MKQNDRKQETSLTLSAAPPLESPSSFVRIAPVIPISSLKELTNPDHIIKKRGKCPTQRI